MSAEFHDSRYATQETVMRPRLRKLVPNIEEASTAGRRCTGARIQPDRAIQSPLTRRAVHTNEARKPYRPTMVVGWLEQARAVRAPFGAKELKSENWGSGQHASSKRAPRHVAPCRATH